MQKILITQKLFFTIRYIISKINPNNMSKKDEKIYQKLVLELDEKYNKIYDRMRYSEVIKADTQENKKVLLDNYHRNKGKGL